MTLTIDNSGTVMVVTDGAVTMDAIGHEGRIASTVVKTWSLDARSVPRIAGAVRALRTVKGAYVVTLTVVDGRVVNEEIQ